MPHDLPKLDGVVVSRFHQWPWTPTCAALELFHWGKLSPWFLRWVWYCPLDAAIALAKTSTGAALCLYAARLPWNKIALSSSIVGGYLAIRSLRYQPRAPVIIEPIGAEQATSSWLAEFVERHRPQLKEVVDECGAVLFRGFGLAPISIDGLEDSVHAAEDVLEAACMRPTSFFGQAPRKMPPGWRFLFRNVSFEAGLLPKGLLPWLQQTFGLVWSKAPQFLTFHNEMAYLNSEKHLGAYGVFFCPLPSLVGGFTPISDAQRVLGRLKNVMGNDFPVAMRWVLARKKKTPVPKKTTGGYLDFLLGNFELEGVEDQFWPTREVDEIYRFAKSLDLDVDETEEELIIWSRWISPERELKDGGSTWWCNGNHCAVGSADVFGRPDALRGLPFRFRFNDGTERCATISEILQISWAWWQEATFFRWKAGDLLMFNNQVVAHNATPGLGPRMVLPSFGNCWSEV